MVQCNRCHKQNLGETKRRLRDASTNIVDLLTNKLTFLNLLQSQNIFLNDHNANDMQLIPLELTKSNRNSVRKAREACLIDRGQTLEPLGLNRRDET